jgi:hypothetical protein
MYDDLTLHAEAAAQPGRPAPALPTRAEYTWALRTVQSRTVRVDPGPGPGGSDAGPVRGMVPVLDLLNHGPGRATEVEVGARSPLSSAAVVTHDARDIVWPGPPPARDAEDPGHGMAGEVGVLVVF